jgi:secreted Zn-dependent insulinase-like peptidase
VQAGSWLEPNEIPGLAHFLEHMSFLSAKDSMNRTLDVILSENGGYSNAYTTD